MPWTPPITLTPREPPLDAVGVVARGAALAALSAATRRALTRGEDLRAATADDWLVVLGDFDALPWADGCVYVGRDGPLLIPTTRAVSPSADLVAAALTTRPLASGDPSPGAVGPSAVSPSAAGLSRPTSCDPAARGAAGPVSAPPRRARSLVVLLEDAVLVGPLPVRTADPEALP